jgi:hypothetical protein
MSTEKTPTQELIRKHTVLHLKQKMEILKGWKRVKIKLCKSFPHEIGKKLSSVTN